jgi:prepilin-type N-terminal cleavage/methylation domain-containing protein
MTRHSRGFTLTELLISLAIVGLLASAFTKLLVSQSRFFTHEANLRVSRAVARTATNILVSDLRMVQDSGGVDSVTNDGKLIRIRVPYRYGLLCGVSGNVTTVSMLPTDSATVGMSVYTGFAVRNAAGRYDYVEPPNPTTTNIPVVSTTPALCTGSANGQAQIRTVSANGRAGDILDLKSPGGVVASAATPVFLWQRITYSFRASSVYPNRLGLWRNVQGGRNEELMAPFDTSARFKFYQAGDDVSRLTPPLLSDIRGVDIVLAGLSAAGTTRDSVSKSTVVTSVFFKNVRAF